MIVFIAAILPTMCFHSALTVKLASASTDETLLVNPVSVSKEDLTGEAGSDLQKTDE